MRVIFTFWCSSSLEFWLGPKICLFETLILFPNLRMSHELSLFYPHNSISFFGAMVADSTAHLIVWLVTKKCAKVIVIWALIIWLTHQHVNVTSVISILSFQTFLKAKQLCNLCSQEHSWLVFAANDLFLGIPAFRCSKDKMAVHFLCKTILDILLSLDSNKQNQHSWYGSKHSQWKILLHQKILVVEFV